MRTLLYFRLEDVITARLAQARLDELAGTSALVAGPWFVQRDNTGPVADDCQLRLEIQGIHEADDQRTGLHQY
ncbi:hypothetical protein [Cupriavidus lacunae]|uniref:hypothetical protein n=1 Tax=Cupriavidus lacunae TaxID=2666307 RepID=UPI001FC926C8|nr:hypothetical protein [Cupriavidus lacunae]